MSRVPAAAPFPRAAAWQLYVMGYTAFFGVPLLVLPTFMVELLGFPPTDPLWVRLTGMFLLAFSYLSFLIHRQQSEVFLRASILIRAVFALIVVSLSLAGNPPFLWVMAALITLGVSGSWWGYRKDRRELPVGGGVAGN
jgi:thiol:disulfide interchange protein